MKTLHVDVGSILCTMALSLGACGEAQDDTPNHDGSVPGSADAQADAAPMFDAAPLAPSDAGGDGATTDAGSDSGPLDPRTPSAFLSETGLYSNPEQTTLASGIVEYKVRNELWADGATKRRFFYLPPATQIDTHDPDSWVFPVGTKVWKEFSRDGVRVETRLIEKAALGKDGWKYVAYGWNAQQTQAAAVPFGQTAALGTQHDIPDQTSCFDCHSGDGDGDFVLGVSAFGLFADGEPLSLATLTRDARLSQPLNAADVVIPGNATAQAALGTLHANCAHCHRPGTFAYEKANLDLRVTVGVRDVAQTPAYKTSVGMAVGQIFENVPNRIKAGSPEQSAVYTRMISRTRMVAMPSVGTKVADTEGAALVAAWIRSLAP